MSRKSVKTGRKTGKHPKKAIKERNDGGDVTRDSVIITRDTGVIRNHTHHISQGHKRRNKSQPRQESHRKVTD